MAIIVFVLFVFLKFRVINAGKKSPTCTQRACETSSFSERTQCKEASKGNTEMHTSSGSSTGSGSWQSTCKAFTSTRGGILQLQQQEIDVCRNQHQLMGFYKSS